MTDLAQVIPDLIRKVEGFRMELEAAQKRLDVVQQSVEPFREYDVAAPHVQPGDYVLRRDGEWHRVTTSERCMGLKGCWRLGFCDGGSRHAGYDDDILVRRALPAAVGVYGNQT